MIRLLGVVAGLVVTLGVVTGCGDGGSAAAPQHSAGTPPSAASAGAPDLQFRLVAQAGEESGACSPGRATTAGPVPTPPPGACRQFAHLHCARPGAGPAGPADSWFTACDEKGTPYLLAPADVVTPVASAQAESASSAVLPVVVVDLPPDGALAFGRLSRRVAGSGVQVGIVLDGTVLSAPTIQTVIADGRIQISGDFAQQQAEALAARLTGD